MGMEFAAVAAATAVVGYDILQGVEWRRKSYGRLLQSFGVTGSAAAGDCDFDLYVNGVKFGSFKNLATGWPTRDHVMNVNIPVRANALIEAKMTTAPTTNPINVVAGLWP